MCFSITREGEGADCDAFSISIYYFTWPRCLLQLQPSSPSKTSILIAFNFNSCRLHLKSLSPNLTLVSFNFNPRHHSISKPHCFSISSPSP
jgi:hypothetical protein